MKVKLSERVRRAVDGDAAAGREIDANRMTIVDDFQRRGFVINLNRGERRIFLRVLSIDRRLALAGLAGSETRIEVAPVRWAICAGVSPVRA